MTHVDLTLYCPNPFNNVLHGQNGGPADGFNGNMACNWPLRGMKREVPQCGVVATCG